MKKNAYYTPISKVPGRPGYYFNRDGYVLVHVSRGRFELEHRAIACRVLNRSLRNDEEVHHINGLKFDNRKNNLLICSRDYHNALHHRILKRYGSWHPPFFGDVQAANAMAAAAGEHIVGSIRAPRRSGASDTVAPKLTGSAQDRTAQVSIATMLSKLGSQR